MVIAPRRTQVIDKGLAEAGLLAHIEVSKYGDHIPLERIRKILRRSGIDLPISTLTDWVAYCGDLLEPLARRIGELALKSSERVGLGVLRVAPSGFALRKVLEGLAETNLEKTPNTQLFNQTGQPAISLPLHHTADGLPIGMQLSAPMGGEGTLIRLSAQLEAAHPWIDRKPPVIA